MPPRGSRVSIASLFNPILYPDTTPHLDITQEEIGALSGISRQNANQCLNRLEKEGLLSSNMVASPSSTSSACAAMANSRNPACRGRTVKTNPCIPDSRVPAGPPA